MIRIIAHKSMGMIVGVDCPCLACFWAIFPCHHSLRVHEVIKPSYVGENVNNAERMDGSNYRGFYFHSYLSKFTPSPLIYK